MGLGLGMILGGALQGAGAGMAAQATADAEQRRAIALQQLKQENAVALDGVQTSNAIKTNEGLNTLNIARDTKQADLNDRNDARKTGRDTSATIVIDSNRGKIQAASDAVKFKQQKELKQIDFSNDKALATLKADIELASDKEKLAYADALESDNYAGTAVNDAGEYVIVSKDGSTKNAGFKVQPKESEETPVWQRTPDSKPAPKSTSTSTTIKFDKNGNIVK